ncbi:MAG: D-xylose ABC transporter ATP-binding protein [Proteobacteria bacterium]|nr:MAG: D-xylose ABC transporter ATP-binding protein [Pseudomonadota bacterium]
MASDVLTATNVSKHYGGVAALRNARFSLRAGEVHALMGENGAGKSTLARVLAGVTQADSAEIEVGSRPAHIGHPLDAQRLGIGIIHQELDLFPSLTVGENITLGNLCFTGGSLEAFCRPFLRQVGLDCSVRRVVDTLSIGARQLLAIARALSMNARILLMDEPTSSLFDDAVERLFGLIAGLKERGVAVVYVSHKMDEIFRVCDRLTVLRDGETIATHDVAGTTTDEVIRLMVGRTLASVKARAAAARGPVALEVRLPGISFDLHRGEVLGIAGLVGSGRSELGEALYRLYPRRVGLLPEDRRTQGLMPDMSVLENGTLAVLGRMQRCGFVRAAKERAAMSDVGRRLALQCASLDAPVSTLSGGNQQKVLLARWLLRDPEVFFLDDPTRGIDIAAKQDIYAVIDALSAVGKAILLVSSELPELLRCSSRIVVLNTHRLAAIYDAKEATQEAIMAAATDTRLLPERRA